MDYETSDADLSLLKPCTAVGVTICAWLHGSKSTKHGLQPHQPSSSRFVPIDRQTTQTRQRLQIVPARAS